MDLSEFEAALGKPAAKPAQEGDLSEFEAALAQSRAPRESKVSSAPKAKGPDTLLNRIGPSTIGNVGAAVDLAYGLLPQIAGVVVEAGSRLAYRNEPKRVRDAAAAMDKQKFVETFDRPIGKLMGLFGFRETYDESDIERVMQAIGKAAEKGGDKISESTGGAVSKEDFLATIDALTAGLGAAGAKYSLGRIEKATSPTRGVERFEPSAGIDLANRVVDRFQRKPQATQADVRRVENTLMAENLEAAENISKPTEVRATPAQERAKQAKAEAAQRAKKRDDVRAALAEDGLPTEAQMRAVGGEGWELSATDRNRRLAEGEAERAAARRVEMTRLTPGQAAPRTRPPERIEAQERPVELRQNEFGDLIPETPDALTSATQKIERGRSFDLTAEELVALRASGSQWNRPKIATAALVGATGLGLAMALEPSAEEAALAMGAGALIANPGGARASLKAIQAMPDTTPLGAILRRSPYTLSTLEMLPNNRFEFSKAQIEQLLKRQEVTKAERDVFAKALAGAEGETITAKQLMAGIKEATGDFELDRMEVADFADYGLEAIDRKASSDYGALSPDELTQVRPARGVEGAWIVDNEFGDYGIQVTAASADEALAAAQKIVQQANEVEESATTTLYRSPVVLGENNHFGDPNYFAHTRSFVEGGVRHVVELQSDLAQRAGKELTPEKIAELQAERKNLVFLGDLNNDIYRRSSREVAGIIDKRVTRLPQEYQDVFLNYLQEHGIRSVADAVKRLNAEDHSLYYVSAFGRTINNALEQVYNRVTLRQAEIDSSLASTSGAGAVRPMLKDWHKRLVREEISRAASELEARRGQQATYLAEKQRELASAEADLRQQSIPKAWASAMSKKVEDAAYDLRVMAMDLKKGHVSEGTVRQYMLKQEQLLPPEAQREWRDYFENSADETEGFLRPGKGEEGEWGGDYASNFPRVMAEFLEASLGRPTWTKSLQEHIGYLKEQVAAAEKQVANPAIRFATADTVAKVEGWPDGRAATEQRLANLERQRIRAMEGAYVDGLRPDVALSRIEQLIDHEKSILAGMAPGRNFKPQHQGIYDRYNRDVTKFLKQLGGKEVTDATGNTWIEVPLEPKKGGAPLTRTQMFGLGAAGVGVGALVATQEDPQFGEAALAMGLMTNSRSPAVKAASRHALSVAENVLGNLSTSIRRISEAALRPVRRHEIELLKHTYQALKDVTPFVERFQKLPADTKAAISSALFSGEKGNVVSTLRALDPQLLVEFEAVRKRVGELGRGLVNAGRLKALRPEYFPRIVVDYEGLLRYLGSDGGATVLEKRLAAAESRALKETGEGLGAAERSAIISDFLSQQMRGPGKAGFLKKRSVEQVTQEMLPFYAPADEALVIYLRNAVREVERAKFFGKSAVRDPDTGRLDISKSIHNIVEEQLRNKEMTFQEAETLKRLLQSRFGPGEASMAHGWEVAKNLGYAALLAQPTAALVQLGDVATVAYAHGILPTIKAVGQTLTRTGKITTADFGLIDNISAETASVTGLAKFTNRVFKASGFNLVDRFGKSTAINAAFEKYAGLARSEKGIAKIREKYGDYFGPEDLGKLLSDLRSRTRTPLVDELVFSELSDLQPVSRVELPKAYNDAPNGRILYMLKSFMLKQADIVRRDVWREWQKGNKLKATNNALRFSVALGVAGASTEFVRNWLLGREDELEWSDMAANISKTFLLSEYALSQNTWGKTLDVIKNSVLPPTSIVTDIADSAQLTLRWLGGDEESLGEGKLKAVRYIPVFGQALYHDALPVIDLELGGAARYNRALEDRERKKQAKERREEMGQ